MKKLLIGLFMLFPSFVYAAGSCTVTEGTPVDFETSEVERTIIFTCTGDASDGSIPNTDISSAQLARIKYWRLTHVEAGPTSGGTAPDAADVFILMDGQDLLGSSDAGTTADGNGANLIHATAIKTTDPIYNNATMVYHPLVRSTLTLKVTNQATNSANYYVKLFFSPPK